MLYITFNTIPFVRQDKNAYRSRTATRSATPLHPVTRADLPIHQYSSRPRCITVTRTPFVTSHRSQWKAVPLASDEYIYICGYTRDMGKRSEMENVTSLSRKISLDIYSPYTYSITGPHPSIHPSYKILWDIAERRCLFHDTSSMNGSDQLNQHTPCLLILAYPLSYQDPACRRVCFSSGYLDDRKSVVIC